MQAMILAAGFGTRLKPFTTLKPKPLFPLLNTPLLVLTIRRLQLAGCDHIVVNCHHLRDQVETAVNGISGVYLSEEMTILGTGGGLRTALPLFREEPLLVTNGDIYHTIDYWSFYNHHISSGAQVTLAVHDYPRFNGLSIEGGRLLSFDRRQHPEMVAFTGLHMINPEILRAIPAGQASCIVDHYRAMLDQGKEIDVFRTDGAFWTDIGTPEDYLALHGDLLSRKIRCWKELQEKCITSFYLDGDTIEGPDFRMQDWACIGRVKIGKNVTVCRSVIWDGAVLPDNSVITDSLIV